MDNLRTTSLLTWLASQFSTEKISLDPMSGDAGFRRYFRFHFQGNSYIAVDAPKEYSNNQAFVTVQGILQALDISVPKIIALDLEQGFFCLSDFGDNLLSSNLSPENMQQYYTLALGELIKTLTCERPLLENLPDYDEPFIRIELNIFKDWLLEKHLSINLNINEQAELNACFDYLVAAIIAQPKVFMHRDFHSRNIMLLADGQLGMIDFQDAVYGPVTYDLVSLLRDCYVRWPNELIAPVIELHRQKIQALLPGEELTTEKWQYWFDLTGLQRHLKASGIFARLHHRDDKSGYLADIPLTLSYIKDVSAQYDKLSFLHELVSKRVIPALNKVQRNAS